MKTYTFILTNTYAQEVDVEAETLEEAEDKAWFESDFYKADLVEDKLTLESERDESGNVTSPLIGADKPSRIEENLLTHWETVIETDGEVRDVPLYDEWHDENMNNIRTEVYSFVECILPQTPSPEWAFWTDGIEILTKSEELAARLEKIVSFFADGHYHRYDPEEDAKLNETDDHTGYWYVDWD